MQIILQLKFPRISTDYVNRSDIITQSKIQSLYNKITYINIISSIYKNEYISILYNKKKVL